MSQNPFILIINDDDKILDLFKDALANEPFRASFVKNAKEALSIIASDKPDLIVLDWELPDLSGLDIAKKIRSVTSLNNTYLILHTEKSDTNSIVEALNFVDSIITKSVIPKEEIVARIKAGIRSRDVFQSEEDAIDSLQKVINTLQKLFYDFAEGMIEQIEKYDILKFGHSKRVAKNSLVIIKYLNIDQEKKSKVIPSLKMAGLLHDIGKMGVSIDILSKKGDLTREEFEKIKKHPEIAVDILEGIESFKDITSCIKYHHERWDGEGYPEKLKGNQIPIASQIINIAETFDALVNNKNEAVSQKDAIKIITDEADKQFSSKIVSAFLEAIKKDEIEI